VARRLVDRYQSLRKLGDAAPAELSEMTGLDPFEVLRVQTLLELGRRLQLAGPGPQVEVVTADDVVGEIVSRLGKLRDAKKEHFYAVLLDSKGKIMRLAEIHVGTLNQSLVGAREVFREAIREGASSIIVAHNHPSGDPEPSPEDMDITRSLRDLGEQLDIPLMDHIILGEGKKSFVSLRRRSWL